MKKADRLTKAISIVLFAAMLCYLGFALGRRLTRPVRTALAVEAVLTDAVPMTGLVIRQESVLLSARNYIDITAADGERIAAGGTVATAYTSEQALDRALQLDALERTLQEAEAVLAAEEEAAAQSFAVQDSLEAISAALRSGDLRGIDLQAEALASFLGQGDSENFSQDYLRSLRKERDALLASAGGDSQLLTVEAAGTFSSILDGYEDLTPEAARLLTPQSLQALLDDQRSTPSGAFGKMIGSHKWIYAARMDAGEAEALAAGETVQISFGRYYAEYLEAEVLQVGQASRGQCVVLFELDRAMTELLAVRKTSAELIRGGHSGLRVPVEGLYRYYAGYAGEDNLQDLQPGDTVTLEAAGASQEAVISEIGEPGADGRCLLVVFWPWTADNALPDTGGETRLTAGEGGFSAEDYYDEASGTERLCVFTMTGLQAERKKVSLVYAADGFCLVESQGEDALREGNEIIVQAPELFDGKVFD